MGTLLTVRNIETWYGPVNAIKGVSLDVHAGDIVTVLGANGAGKTTLLNTIAGVIDLLDLTAHRHSPVAGLPYGVRKVVELARALATQPRLLLLDEPASGLNPEESRDVAFWIEDIQQDLGITVIMVEHDMSLVSQAADRVLCMNMGEVLALGTPHQVQNDPAVIAAYLGG